MSIETTHASAALCCAPMLVHAHAFRSARFRPTAWLLSLCAGGLLGCTPSPTAHFRGASAPAVVTSDDLLQHTYVPHDHVTIGVVTAACERDRTEAGDDAPCSELSLLRSMRKAAADAGGTAFVAPSCQFTSAAASRQQFRCTATVARRQSLSTPSAKASNATAARERQWVEPINDRQVLITAIPAPGVEPTPHERRVRRAWAAEPGSKQLGSVRATCVKRCERGQVERGLERGAAWLGAEQLATVQCHEVQSGRWQCTADAVSAP